MTSGSDAGLLLGLVLASYVLGAMPWGYWIVRRARGVDVRAFGSGNIGTTNVWRVAGPGWALLVLALDVCKGAAPVLVGARVLPGELSPAAAGAAAILGHSRSVFLGFAGGKAVATALGVFAALAPLPAAGALAVFATCLAATRTVSVSALAAAWSLPLWLHLAGAPGLHLGLGVGAAGWITWRHRANLSRLAAGEEHSL